MKPITVYEADDGSRHNTMKAAREKDRLVAEVKQAMSWLADKVSLKDDEYIQHGRDECLNARRGLVLIARRLYQSSDVFKNDPDVIHPMSKAGRIISDTEGPLNSAWHRLMCINWSTYREYNQPYFALHPDKSTSEEN